MEQEEEKNIIIEFQRKVLQEANCTAEMLAYLDEIDDDVLLHMCIRWNDCGRDTSDR